MPERYYKNGGFNGVRFLECENCEEDYFQEVNSDLGEYYYICLHCCEAHKFELPLEVRKQDALHMIMLSGPA